MINYSQHHNQIPDFSFHQLLQKANEETGKDSTDQTLELENKVGLPKELGQHSPDIDRNRNRDALESDGITAHTISTGCGSIEYLQSPREYSEEDIQNRLKGESIEPEKSGNRKLKKGKKKNPDGPFQCEHCPKVYPSQGGLSYHRFIYHSAQYTPPVCDMCGKTFRIQKYLESHKNTVHFKHKDHLCDLCGKGFASKYSLKLHKIWHKGEKNFFCDICGMRFSTIGKVNTHKQVHGGPKNYICEICSRAFRWKKSLFTHMRTHSGERPYKCEHCERTFSALWNMQQHVRIHTGERPYKCEVCGKAFALNASLKEHRNRHHKT